MAKDTGYVSYWHPQSYGASGTPHAAQRVPAGMAELNGRGAVNSFGARAYAPEDFALLYNNFIDKGLQGTSYGKLYNTLRNTSNAITSLELGMSGFHAFTMANEAMINGMAAGVSQAFTPGQRARALKTLVTSPAQAVTSAMRGKQLKDVYLNQKQGTPRQRQVADLATSANARLVGRGHAGDYNYSAHSSFYRSWKRGALMKEFQKEWQDLGNKPWTLPFAAVRQVGRVMQTMSQPLFEHYIPALKDGAIYDNISKWLDANPNATHAEALAATTKIVDSVDNRFGEMNQDNLFWNKTQQQIAQLGLRSYSWTLGTTREIGGGAGSLVGNVVRGRNPLNMQSPHYDPRAAYVIALPMGAALTAAVYQYLKTGDAPNSWMDLIGPRTGGRVAAVGGYKYGTVPERAATPGYQKDVVGWLHDPLQEANNKLATFWHMVGEQVMGEDWAVQPFIPPNAGVAENLWARAKQADTHLRPISAEVFIKGNKEGSNISTIERLMGISPARGHIQDPEGMERAMQAKTKRAWQIKTNRDKRQEQQYR
jgi:hypothetical protein